MQHPKDVKGSDKPKSLLSIPVGQRYTTILDRLDVIESQIESMGNAQRRMWDLLDDTAELTALLSEAQDGID